MTMSPNRLLVSIAIFCAACMLQTAHAEQALAPVTVLERLTIVLPDIDREALVEQVSDLRSQLILRKQALVQVVADMKLDGRDAIITAIMPGGLIYAGYKKARCEQAKDELDRVSADIKEFSGDLLAMQAGSATVAVAQLP